MEDVSAIKIEVRKLIAKGKTAKVFNVLSGFKLNDIDKELIILNGQYNRIQKEMHMNVISKDEAERKVNQINLALLALTEKLGESQKEATLAKQDKQKNLWWKLLLIPLVAICAYFLWQFYFGNTQENPLEHKNFHAFFPFNENIDSHDGKLKHLESTIVYDYHLGHDGEPNSAIYFDGKKGGIVFNTLFLPINKMHFAISFWVKPSIEKEKTYAVFGQFGNANEKFVSTNHYIMIANKGKDQNVLIDEYPPSNKEEKGDVKARLISGAWNHVVIVINGNQELIYVNGKKSNVGDIQKSEQFTLDGYPQYNEPKITVFGGRPMLTKSGDQIYRDNSLKGALDDLFIFDGAIDDETVEALYYFKYQKNED